MEDRIALRKALTSLPDKYQEVILMRFAEGMQFEEIAKTTNTNLEAVKSTFRRAVAALRNNLEEPHDQN
jgi:RNA polymerase sigma factor (sigma-70 family)